MNYRGLEITTVVGCNVNCEYCPQKTFVEAYADRGPRELSLADFKKYIAKVPNDVKIHFSGFSEPFQNPHASEMIVHAHEKGHEIVLFTTLTVGQVGLFRKLKDVKFNRVVVHEVEGTDNEFKNLFRKMGFRYDVARVTKPCTRSGNVKPVEKRGPGPVSCPRSNQPVLLPNGELALCCQDYGLEHIIGNLNFNTYDEILHGPTHRNIIDTQDRYDADILCRFCDIDPGCIDIRKNAGAHSLKSQMRGARTIFLVGLGRSGTTWLAQLLSSNLNFNYVHEPFNWLSFGLGKYRFKYLDPNIPDEKFNNKWRSIEKKHPKVLIKDIHTPFTLPYVEKNFAPERIFVLRRNPLATLDSWLRMGWTIHQQFGMIAEQKVLRDLLPEPVRSMNFTRKPYAFRFAILWATYYTIVEKLGVGEIINYDELVSHNVKELVRFLGFEATARGEKFYREHANTVGKIRHPYTTYRDPDVCLNGWKSNITVYQIEQVKSALERFGLNIKDYISI